MRRQTFKSASSFVVVFSGVAIEHFDVMLINLFATSMAGHFFQPSSGQKQIILGFVGYGISFIFRPLGAALFGIMGDRVGRKPAMLLSLLLMSLATLFLGLTPSVHQIGALSTLFFIICRICQGMSVGGEYGAAMTYAYEVSGERKTLAGALVISATHVGGLIAAVLASRWVHNFQATFLIAGILGLISLGFRSLLVETRPQKIERLSTYEVFKNFRPNLTGYKKAFLAGSCLVFIFYASLIYLNEEIYQRNLASREEIFISNSILLALWVILPILLGYSVDRFKVNYKKVMMAGALGVSFLVFPLLYLAQVGNTLSHFMIVQAVITVLHSAFCFSTPRYLGELFESKIRMTGVSLGYSLGASFTAALTPLICHGLFSAFGSLLALGLPIVVLSGFAAYQLYLELTPKVSQPLEVMVYE